jgi:hypothetical protein
MNLNEPRTTAEKSRIMKKTHLIVVLAGLTAVTVSAPEASAYYHPGMGVWMSRDPGPGAGGPPRVGAGGAAVGGGFIPRDQYADGMNLYQYVRSAPVGYVDWNGAQASRPAPGSMPASGPASRPVPGYADIFQPYAKNKDYMTAAIALDEMLEGRAEKCAPTLTLPKPLEEALHECAKQMKETGYKFEYGGAVTREPGGSYQIWGPIEGGEKNVKFNISFPIEPDRNSVGSYHSHRSKIERLSYDDVETFLSGILGTGYNFNFMTNCDGSSTWGVVALKSVERKNPRLVYERGEYYGDVSKYPTTQGMDDYKRRIYLYLENQLAKDARANGFCFYKRTTASGPLGLVGYREGMHDPRK